MLNKSNCKCEKTLTCMPALRYWPPNLVTGLRLGLTLFAIAAIFNGETIRGAYIILATLIIDMLDGFLAIALNAKSAFGNALDNQADVVNFGAGTAVLLYGHRLQSMGFLGIIICVVPLVLTAVRSSVYLVQDQDGIVFRGLAMPGSALVLLGTVFWDFNVVLLIIITLVTSVLMVAPFRYLKVRGIFAVGATILLLLSAVVFPRGLMLIGLVYAIHGPLYSWFVQSS